MSKTFLSVSLAAAGMIAGLGLGRPAMAESAPADTPPAEFHLAPLSTFAEVTARPMFSPDRRPREAAPVEAGPTVPLALKGIAVSGSTRYALVEEGAAQKRVAEGQTVQAGTIKRIDRDRVVLTTSAGNDVIVKLFGRQPGKPNDPPSASSTGTQPAAAAPPPAGTTPPQFPPPDSAQGRVSRQFLGRGS